MTIIRMESHRIRGLFAAQQSLLPVFFGLDWQVTVMMNLFLITNVAFVGLLRTVMQPIILILICGVE